MNISLRCFLSYVALFSLIQNRQTERLEISHPRSCECSVPYSSSNTTYSQIKTAPPFPYPSLAGEALARNPDLSIAATHPTSHVQSPVHGQATPTLFNRSQSRLNGCILAGYDHASHRIRKPITSSFHWKISSLALHEKSVYSRMRAGKGAWVEEVVLGTRSFRGRRPTDGMHTIDALQARPSPPPTSIPASHRRRTSPACAYAASGVWVAVRLQVRTRGVSRTGSWI